MWERFVERTLEHVSPWAWVAAGAALLLSWQPARKGLRSLAVTGVKNGIIIGDRLGDLKANWRQAWLKEFDIQGLTLRTRMFNKADFKEAPLIGGPGALAVYGHWQGNGTAKSPLFFFLLVYLYHRQELDLRIDLPFQAQYISI